MSKKITMLIISHLLCVLLGYSMGVILTKFHEPNAKNIDTTESRIPENTNQTVETTEEMPETVASTEEETFTVETEGTETPATEKPASKSPTAKPPAPNPPATQPPATTPPVTMPPATQPPAGGHDEGFSGGRA